MNIRDLISIVESSKMKLFEGAQDFMVTAKGKNMRDAFSNAVSEAQHEYGHRGYTGSIAEKHSFVPIRVPAGRDPQEYAYEMLSQEGSPVDDKWGPAGCIDLGNGEYMFFGMASS